MCAGCSHWLTLKWNLFRSVQSLKLRLCEKKSSLFFFSVFVVLKFRSIVCSGLRELDLHIQFVVFNMLTCREVRQPLFFIEDQFSFRKPQLLAAGTTCSSGLPLLCSLHFHYREQTFLYVDSNERTGDCFLSFTLLLCILLFFSWWASNRSKLGLKPVNKDQWSSFSRFLFSSWCWINN